MEISLSAINTAYAQWVSATGAVTDAQAALQAHLPRPAYPTIVTTDDSYNLVTDQQETWDTTNGTLLSTLQDSISDCNTAEQNVINLMPPAQWVNLVNTGSSPYNVYIGYLPANNTLHVLQTAPTNHFPAI